MSDTHESPFGLTFTPSTIIASRFSASGSVELIKRPLSPGYQEYYQDAVRHRENVDEARDMKRAESIFHNATTPIIESLSRQLGHAPEYAAIFVPSIFDQKVRDIAVRGVVDDYLERVIRPGMSREATCHGDGFLEGRNLGRAPEECVNGGALNLIFFLEYEEDYLYAWLMEVEFELQTYPVILKEICIECGVRYHGDIGAKAYRERVNVFLDNFIGKAFQRHQRNSIRSIIISGEAATPWTTVLGEMARRAVGTETVKVMAEFDPSEVVAHGAAVWARLVQQLPHVFKPDAGNRIAKRVSHNEL